MTPTWCVHHYESPQLFQHIWNPCVRVGHMYIYIYIIISCMIKQLSHINNKVFKKKQHKKHIYSIFSLLLRTATNSLTFRFHSRRRCSPVQLFPSACTLAIPAALVNSASAWRQAAAASARQACILTPSSTQSLNNIEWPSEITVTTVSDHPRLLCSRPTNLFTTSPWCYSSITNQQVAPDGVDWYGVAATGNWAGRHGKLGWQLQWTRPGVLSYVHNKGTNNTEKDQEGGYEIYSY